MRVCVQIKVEDLFFFNAAHGPTEKEHRGTDSSKCTPTNRCFLHCLIVLKIGLKAEIAGKFFVFHRALPAPQNTQKNHNCKQNQGEGRRNHTVPALMLEFCLYSLWAPQGIKFIHGQCPVVLHHNVTPAGMQCVSQNSRMDTKKQIEECEFFFWNLSSDEKVCHLINSFGR